jgi:hypothetical protein
VGNALFLMASLFAIADSAEAPQQTSLCSYCFPMGFVGAVGVPPEAVDGLISGAGGG